MKKIHFSVLFGVVLTLLARSQSLGQVTDIGDATNYSKSLAVSPGGTLTMDVDRGGVHITGADQTTVEIQVRREVTGASDSDTAKILQEEHVVIGQTTNSISINSSEPSSLQLGWRNEPNLNV